MSKRRAHGSGTISKRGATTWLVQVNAVDPVTGKRRRRSRVVHGAKGDAQDALTELQSDLGKSRADRSNSTLDELMAAYFDALDARPSSSKSSVDESRAAARRYIPDRLGGQPLRKIGAYELDALYRHLEAGGGVCRRRKEPCEGATCEHGKGAPLSPATVLRLHHDIHAAYEQAVRWQWVRSNPADLVTLSDVVEDQVDVDPDEVIALLQHIAQLASDTATTPGSRLPAFVDVLLATGARPAEACALTWGQLELDRVVNEQARPQVKIDASIARTRGGATRKSTKTQKTRRPVLDAYTTGVLAQRRSDWLPAALAAGVPLEQLHVFPSTTNVLQPVRPDVVSREFRAARQAAGASEQITLRNLRHLVASLLAEAGVHPTTIAGRLGHSAAVLLARYAHLTDAGNAAAAGIVNKRLGRSS